MLNLKEACEYLKISKSTIHRWEREGLISSIRTVGKHRRYQKFELDRVLGKEKVSKDLLIIGYCRVSTTGQTDDLDRQANLIELYCASKGYNFEIIKDIGSGLNYNKKGFRKLINLILERKISKIVLNYKDRMVRFGYEIIEQLCEFNDVDIEIINLTENKTHEEELVEDVLSVITVFSARLYGSRSHKTKKTLEENKKLFKNK